MTNKKCLSCQNARQVGNLSSVEKVGCVRLTNLEFRPPELKGIVLYNGYFFSQRRPGEDGESKVLGKGIIDYGILISSDEMLSCFIER